MIDIIVLANTINSDIERSINSILYQYLDNIKYSIYLMNYGNRDYKDIISYYDKVCKIKELKSTEKLSSNLAKQYALEKTKGKYIVFINGGDMFSNPFAIDLLYKTMEEDNLDAVFSSYTKQKDDDFITICEDKLFSYGKIYRREFIKDNNIFFNDSKINNSLAFNRLILLKSSKVKFIEDSTYMVYKNNNDFSINYEIEYTSDYLNDVVVIIENYVNDKDYKKSIIGELSLTAIYYSYINYLVNGNYSRIDKNTLIKLINIYNKHKLSDNREIMVKKSCIDNQIIVDYLITASITYNEFINEVLS